MCIRDRLVVEDGPTLTHGEMKIGAGTVAANKFGAAELVDPRAYAVGKPVSYTHLDVYKRQAPGGAVCWCLATNIRPLPVCYPAFY